MGAATGIGWTDHTFSDFARFHEIEPRQEWLQLWGLHVCVWYVPEEQDAICTALAAGRVP